MDVRQFLMRVDNCPDLEHVLTGLTAQIAALAEDCNDKLEDLTQAHVYFCARLQIWSALLQAAKIVWMRLNSPRGGEFLEPKLYHAWFTAMEHVSYKRALADGMRFLFWLKDVQSYSEPRSSADIILELGRETGLKFLPRAARNVEVDNSMQEFLSVVIPQDLRAGRRMRQWAATVSDSILDAARVSEYTNLLLNSKRYNLRTLLEGWEGTQPQYYREQIQAARAFLQMQGVRAPSSKQLLNWIDYMSRKMSNPKRGGFLAPAARENSHKLRSSLNSLAEFCVLQQKEIEMDSDEISTTTTTVAEDAEVDADDLGAKYLVAAAAAAAEHPRKSKPKNKRGASTVDLDFVPPVAKRRALVSL